MFGCVLCLILAGFFACPARAGFYTYAEWAALPLNQSAAYIAGAYDSYVGFALNDDDVKRDNHFNQCVKNSRMNNGQLAQNIQAFASTRPNLQGAPPQAALVQYLIALCGAVPK